MDALEPELLRSTTCEEEVRRVSRERSSLLFYSFLFYSLLFYSLPLSSILFYSILFYSIPFYRGIPPSSPLYSILLLSFCALLGGYGRHVLRIRRSNRQRNASVFDERGAVHEAGAYALVPAPLPSASISSSRPPNPNAILSRDASQCLPHGKSS